MSTFSYMMHMNEPNDDTIKEAKTIFQSVSSMNKGFLPMTSVIAGSKVQSGESSIRKRTSNSGNTRWGVEKGKPISPNILKVISVEKISQKPTVVAARIDDALKNLSVEVQFDGKNAEAKCNTDNFVEYNIYLYESDDGESTYVELIRCSGCGFAFARERTAVINAANGLGVPERNMELTIPGDIMKYYEPQSKSELQTIIHRTSDLCYSKDQRVVLFALENLAIMTNSVQSHTDTAHTISELFISNESNILDVILAIYSERYTFDKYRVSDQIWHSCLSIMFHGLQYLASKGEGFLDQTYDEFAGKLLPHLIKDVEKCESNRSNNSYLALKCLHLILTHSSRARQDADHEAKIRDAVMHAKQYGSKEYLNLEKVADETIVVLASNKWSKTRILQ